AEYKTRSPSGLHVERDLMDYIRTVELHAVGLSVLTEELYFGGSYSNLVRAASATSIPILIKDIIVSHSQIETAYNVGADAVLLIASILSDRELDKLYEEARGYGLEALVEVHTVEEARNVVEMGYPMIGVNSRNLLTLEVSVVHAYKVLETIPNRFTKVAESGIKSRSDIEYLRRVGAKAFLVGTELMKNPLKIFDLASPFQLH
ncbi:MAG: indole-3-glycerol phosphate synthase TrpC, partial [Ignisphaera sp.]